MRRLLMLTAGAAIAACAVDRPLDSPFGRGGHPLGVVGSCYRDGTHTTQHLGAAWDCGTTVKVWVQNGSGTEVSATSAAGNIWNNSVFGTYGLPAFAPATTQQPTGHYM